MLLYWIWKREGESQTGQRPSKDAPGEDEGRRSEPCCLGLAGMSTGNRKGLSLHSHLEPTDLEISVCPLVWLLFLLLSDFPAYLVLRGSLQGCSVPLFSLNQGQLELLRRLFTEALYEETLSQVSLGRWAQEAFLLDAPGLELK